MARGIVKSMTVATAVGVVAACGGGGSSKPAKPVSLSTKQVFNIAKNGTFELHGREGSEEVGGTGILINKARGYLITNAHVVSGVAALQARLTGGQDVPARVIGIAPCDDIAVVQLTTVPTNARALALGDSAKVSNQDSVTALGFPASFADPTQESVVSSSGTVESPNVAASPDPGLPHYPSTIQHSATINHGNSGGPLLNDRGQVIGVNTLSAFAAGQEGQYYAISINHVKTLLSSLESGHNQAYAGWSLAPLSEIDFSQLLPTYGYGSASDGETLNQDVQQGSINGLFVLGVDAGSPADKVNVSPDDIIYQLQGVTVNSVADVCSVLQSASPGQELRINGNYTVNASSAGHQFGDQWQTEMSLQQ